VSQVEIMALNEHCNLSCTIVSLRTVSNNNAEFEFNVQCWFVMDRYGPILYNSFAAESSWKSAGFSANKEVHSGLWNLKVQYRVHNSQPLLPLQK
jgi:hypothetical protein